MLIVIVIKLWDT